VRIRICIFALSLPVIAMAGLVRFEVTERSAVLEGKAFGVISPVDRKKGNGTLLFEVGNRGRKSLLTVFSRAKSSFGPRTAGEFGDGLLLEQGFTLAWVGWQFDVPREPLS
jgi:hypothetical protein